MSDNCDMAGGLSRRRALAVAGGFAALAGCLGTGDDDDGTDDPADDGSADDDTQNGSDDPNGDGTENGDENGGDEPGELSLSALTLDGETESLEAFAETDIPIAVTAENVGGGDEFTLSLGITDAEEPETPPITETTQTLTLDADEQTELVFEDVTTELTEGAYDVTITDAETDETQVSGELVFTTPVVEMTVNVYIESKEEDNRPEAGDLVVSRDGDVVAEKSLRVNPSPTVELPEARGQSYTVEARNVNGGVYPSVETNFAPTSYDPIELDLVSGYEFQTADSFNFTFHRFRSRDSGISEHFGRGSLTASGDLLVDYGLQGVFQQTLDLDDSLPDFETDIAQLRDERYGGPPDSRTGVKIDDQRYYRRYRDESFSSQDEPFHYEPTEHVGPHVVRNGIDAVTDPTPEERTYVGTRDIHGVQTDEYELVFEAMGENYDPTLTTPENDGARVFVDPDTGHILRFQADVIYGLNTGDLLSGFLIWEFYDHNDVDQIDPGKIGGFDPDES